MDKLLVLKRISEIQIDWHKFRKDCEFKMYEHLDRTYRDCDMKRLINLLICEYFEFRDSLTIPAFETIEFDKEELLDIANYCMMLYTVKTLREK